MYSFHHCWFSLPATLRLLFCFDIPNCNNLLISWYVRYKDNPECSTLIDGELDPDGDISKPQISKFLRQLGLKLPAKEKKQSSKTSNQLQGNKRDASKDTTHPNLTPTEKSSSPKRPL